MHYLYFILVGLLFFGCTETAQKQYAVQATETIKHAKGLSIKAYESFSVVTVKNPWPKATKIYQYVLYTKRNAIPDTLASLPQIKIPIKQIVVTSTTHIPSLDMLGVESTLVGFPMLSYVSTASVRNRIEQGKVRELGANQHINFEALVELSPDVVVGYGIDNANTTLDKIAASGIKVILNGDWNEQTPLGKAEWIKLFGALYGKQKQADSLFTSIEKAYLTAKQMASKVKYKPKVMAGSLFQNKWFMPQGNSWGASIIKDAGGDYLYSHTKGTGSLTVPTEQLLARTDWADIWLGPEMLTLADMGKSNPHYTKFRAFQSGKVYNFTNKKGPTGGIIYYELGPNRPDLVLKDVIKILHPELLPGYSPYFFQKLK